MNRPTNLATSESAYLSPSVQRAAKLLRHIAEGDRVINMAKTARELGINRTTLLRLLHTLEADRFIEPFGEDRPGWRVGLGLIGLTAQAFFSRDLVQIAVPVLTRLTETVGMSAHLGVLDGLEVVYLVRRVPNHSFASNIRVGSRLPVFAVTMGRIILANLPRQTVDGLFASFTMEPGASRAAPSIEEMHARLDDDRASGIAWSDGQYEQGISSAAAAVFDATGAPTAAINVSGQTFSFGDRTRRTGIEKAVTAAADEISSHLGWMRDAGASNRA